MFIEFQAFQNFILTTMFKNARRLICKNWNNNNKIFNNKYENCSTSYQFESQPYKLYKLDNGPSTTVTCTVEEAKYYYKQMYTMRKLENSAAELYKEKVIRGFCHLYSGQEACAVGIASVLREQDNVISAYRIHGWHYITGAPILDVLSELAGTKSGCSRGKGGSMHMYNKRFYGGNGIVGAQVPLGVGIGFAGKYKDTDSICVTLYGDGAANQGQVFEAYNIAKLWNLPVMFVCENNLYGMGTSIDRAAACQTFYTRGHYIPGIAVDGMDVLAVREVAQFALDHILKGEGPMIIEAITYRYSGHSMSDPGVSYRSRDEIQKVRTTRDPIQAFKQKLLECEMLTEKELQAIEKEVNAHIKEQIKTLRADKELGMEELTCDLYKNGLTKHIRGITPWDNWEHKNTRVSTGANNSNAKEK